jgi:DNA-binding response OmpR family regulator
MAELGRILIADDEETFLFRTADVLRKEGYECSCALDVETATDMLARSDYDLLIADLRIAGHPDLKFIKGLPEIATGLPVILVTAYPSADSAIEALRLPAAAYLVKPFYFSELLAQTEAAIERFRIYRTVRQAQQRLPDWQQELEYLEFTLRRSPTSATRVSVNTFVTLTLNHIVSALADLQRLTEALTQSPAKPQTCHLLACPKLETLGEAMRDAVNVLEKTKGSFKSKELGELRRKLQTTVGTI